MWESSAKTPLDAATLAESLLHAHALVQRHVSELPPRDIAAVVLDLARVRSASSSEVVRLLAEALLSPSGAAAAVAVPSPPPPHAPVHGLARLTSRELAGVVAALAGFSVRPSNVWLGAAMGLLQIGLLQLDAPQLAQLLWGLVQLGVRPTTPWMALYEEALCFRLREMLPLPAAAAPEAAAPAASTLPGPSAPAVPPAAIPLPGGASASAAASPLENEELVRLLRAAAEVGYQPCDACRSLLLAHTGVALARMQPHQLAGVAWAVARLRWRAEGEWGAAFVLATEAQLPHFKPADLPPVVAAIAASRIAPSRRWLRRCLTASHAAMEQVSPRDLPDLLLGLLDLDVRLFRRRQARAGSGGNSSSSSSGGGGSSSSSSSNGNGNGRSNSSSSSSSTASSSTTASSPRQAPATHAHAAAGAADAQLDIELDLIAELWMDRYLRLCAQKLPRFTASGVARVLLAVARAGAEPSIAWLEAACAALASKHDVLAPSDVADAITALAALRLQPASLSAAMAQPPPATQGASVMASTAGRSANAGPRVAAPLPQRHLQQQLPQAQHAGGGEARAAVVALLLDGCATKLSLLPMNRLVCMAAALVSLDVQPNDAWLQALLAETQRRMSLAAAALDAARRPLAAGGAAVPAAGAGAGAAAASDAAALTPQLLAELLVALAKLDAAPAQPWQRAFARVAGPQLDAFNGPALGGMVWGLAVLGVELPPPWSKRLAQRVREALSASDAAPAELDAWGTAAGGAAARRAVAGARVLGAAQGWSTVTAVRLQGAPAAGRQMRQGSARGSADAEARVAGGDAAIAGRQRQVAAGGRRQKRQSPKGSGYVSGPYTRRGW